MNTPLDLRAMEARLEVLPGCICQHCSDMRALLVAVRKMRAGADKLWREVRANDRAGLVMAAHELAGVLASVVDNR